MVVRCGLTENRVRIVAVDAAQLDLFAAATEGADTEEDFTEEMPAVDPAVTAFVDEVAAIDIDSLSPRDAMNKLYELTEKAKSLG